MSLFALLVLLSGASRVFAEDGLAEPDEIDGKPISALEPETSTAPSNANDATVSPTAPAQSNAEEQSVATVAEALGEATAEKGTISFDRPDVGKFLEIDSKTNEVVVPRPKAAYQIQNEPGTKRALKPADPINDDEIIQTSKNATVTLLFGGNAVIEVSPGTTLKIVDTTPLRIEIAEGSAHVAYRQPKNESKSEPKNAVPESHVETAGPIFAIKGVEFTASARPGKAGEFRASLACTNARAFSQVIRHTPKGLIYQQPFAIKEGLTFSADYRGPFAANYSLDAIRKSERLAPKLVAVNKPIEIPAGPLPGTIDKTVLAKLLPASERRSGRMIASTPATWSNASALKRTKTFEMPETFTPIPPLASDSPFQSPTSLPIYRLPGF